MYIIIVGGGKVGASIASTLIEMGHEVSLIERSESRCQVLRKEFGSVVMHGDGCEASLLADAGTDRAELFIAVTEGDEDNLVACQVAQHRFHVGRVVARVNDPKNERIFRAVGVTPTVSAVDSLANWVLHEVPGRNLSRLAPLRQGALNLLGIKIPPTASSVGKRVTEIVLPESTAIALVVHRDGSPTLPSDEVVLEPDDEVIALGRPEDERALVDAFTI